MNTKVLSAFPIEVLRENLSRLEITIEELQYFCMTLEESSEELKSTNEMLKIAAADLLVHKPKVISLKGPRKSLSIASTLADENTISEVIQEQIEMPKRKSLPNQTQKPILAKRLSIGRPNY